MMLSSGAAVVMMAVGTVDAPIQVLTGRPSLVADEVDSAGR